MRWHSKAKPPGDRHQGRGQTLSTTAAEARGARHQTVDSTGKAAGAGWIQIC